MSKTVFISFSGSIEELDENLVARQKLMNKSAIDISNADEEIAWTRDDLLDSQFYQDNKNILDQSRGAGFWSWKPYIILQTLDKVAKNDWVVYSDIGKPFRRGDSSRAGNLKIGNIMNTPFDSLISFADKQNGFTPGIWIPHYGNAKVWTKRDCFVGMGCDSPRFHNSGQIQAGYSCWSNSKSSRAFLKQWLNWCQISAVISDQENIYGKPNFDEFRDHRHDQSVLTNLVIKNDISLFGPKDKSLDGFRDFNLIIRHMALADTLETQQQSLSLLFDVGNNIYPSYLQQAFNLFLLPELGSGSLIHIHQAEQKSIWESALLNCRLEIKPASFGCQASEKFTAVFANDCAQQESLPQTLAHSYESLKPGGVLIMGPFKGDKTKEAKSNGSFMQLLQWLFINQRFPTNLSTTNNQKQNALTLGNSQNPLIICHEKNRNFVIMRKPHMDISF